MGKLIDLTGQKFGRLTVINKSEKRNASGQVYWNCLCDCGKECTICGTSLRIGKTKSCGCYNLEKTAERGRNRLEDLTGQTFGKLTVLYRVENHIQKNGQQKTQWHCKCECGNECDVCADYLKANRTKSCGCIRKSYGEDLITKILTENKIPFETEYRPNNCVFPNTNRKARFDFFVDNKYFIEFDGKQHFEQEAGWGESLDNIQFRDKYKNDWCKQQNIPLYRIPYTDINEIKTLQDLTQDKYLI